MIETLEMAEANGKRLEVESENQLEWFLGVFLAHSWWHRGDAGVADGVEGEAFLDLAGLHIADELHRANLAAGFHKKADG